MGTLTVPTVKVEIGFGGAGNTPYLIFNDTTRGKFDTGKFAGASTFTDVSAHVYSLSIDRGRTRPLEDYAPGRCTIVLDNTSGNYDPNNLSGAYVSAGVTQVLPMLPLRVRYSLDGTTWYDRFTGFVDRWTQNPRGVQTATTTVTATDGLKVLAAYDTGGPTGSVGAGEDTGARVARVLDMVGVPAGDRDLDVGDSTLQATDLDGVALSTIRNAVQSEQGYFYCAGDGRYTFRNRTSRYDTTATVAVVFSNQLSAGFAWEKLELAYDDELVKNAINATNTGGTLQQATDSASIAKNLTKSYTASALELRTDTAALNWAKQILVSSSNAKQRVDSISFLPAVTWSTSRWATVLGLEFGDIVEIDYDPVAGDTLITYGFFDGIVESVTDGVKWSITLRLTPTTGFLNAIVFDASAVFAAVVGGTPGFDTFQFTF